MIIVYIAIAIIVIYVMHQQDHLLSCQLHPAFPPAWKECGAVRLQMDIVH